MTLIEAVRATLRRLHDSPRTEEAYVHWIRAFIRFHRGKHPRQMGAEEVTAFLNDLAVARRSAVSTQNQALCALLFLGKRVLDLRYPGSKRSNVPAGRSTFPRFSRDGTLSPCSST
ncbi:site-specific integrase [Sorangium sp. So ce1014]